MKESHIVLGHFLETFIMLFYVLALFSTAKKIVMWKIVYKNTIKSGYFLSQNFKARFFKI